jgi:hypothetical protein
MIEIIKQLPPSWVFAAVCVVFVVLVAVIVWAVLQGREVTFWPPKIGPSDQRMPAARQKEEGVPDGLTADLPISAHDVGRWLGRWNCRWMIYVEANDLGPYVDDGITIEHISSETAIVRGTGHTAYGSGGTYKVRGRIVGGRIGVFVYSSNESAFPGLDGMFMVRMSAIGDIGGWWLGRARDGLEIEGRIRFERYKEGEHFEPKLYPYPPLKIHP